MDLFSFIFFDSIQTRLFYCLVSNLFAVLSFDLSSPLDCLFEQFQIVFVDNYQIKFFIRLAVISYFITLDYLVSSSRTWAKFFWWFTCLTSSFMSDFCALYEYNTRLY